MWRGGGCRIREYGEKLGEGVGGKGLIMRVSTWDEGNGDGGK